MERHDAGGSKWTYEYIFWSLFRPELGHTYRVEVVRRLDGASSYADVRIPPPVSTHFDEGDAPFIHVFIEGDDIRALNTEATYLVRGLNDEDPLRIYNFSYQGKEERVEGGWQVTIDMIANYDRMRFLYVTLNPYCNDLMLHELNIELVVGDAVWDPPDGIFDPNIISFPRTMSNVENGFGFVGGGYRVYPLLKLSKEAVELACFEYVEQQ